MLTTRTVSMARGLLSVAPRARLRTINRWLTARGDTVLQSPGSPWGERIKQEYVPFFALILGISVPLIGAGMKVSIILLIQRLFNT